MGGAGLVGKESAVDAGGNDFDLFGDKGIRCCINRGGCFVSCQDQAGLVHGDAL